MGFGYIYRMAKRFSKKKKKKKRRRKKRRRRSRRRRKKANKKKKAYSIQFILFNGNLTININI